jgi:ABC-type microcin C transport system permease subunit YejE
MNSLPNCDVLKSFSRTFSADGEQFWTLLELIQLYVSTDCWAFIVNDEIILNSYNTSSKTFTQIVNEKMIRDKIVEDSYIILGEINRRQVNTKIEIYMFGPERAYKIMINYIVDSDKYVVHRLNSQGYIDEYGDDDDI